MVTASLSTVIPMGLLTDPERSHLISISLNAFALVTLSSRSLPRFYLKCGR